MNTLSTFTKSPLLVILSTGFAWFSIKYLPSAMLLFWLVISVFADLVTGLLKAWSQGRSTTSTGLRKTIIKIGSYVGTVVMVVVLVNLVGLVDITNKFDLTILIDALMGFMVFIELYSICENINQAYPDSLLSKCMITPILKFLKGKLKNNPITSLGKNQTNDTPASKD